MICEKRTSKYQTSTSTPYTTPLSLETLNIIMKLPWSKPKQKDQLVSSLSPRTKASLKIWQHIPLDPSEVSYPVPHFLASTIDIAPTSSLYMNKSLKTLHLRLSACAWAYLAEILNASPIVSRKTLLIKAPFRMVMKYGTEIQLSEAAALRFVAEQTLVPVPKLYCAFEYRGMKFILMELVRGRRLVDIWKKIPSSSQKLLLCQIKTHFEELWAIPHPHPGVICAIGMGPLFDRRPENHPHGYEPFLNERDFNMFLRCGLTDPTQLEPVAHT